MFLSARPQIGPSLIKEVLISCAASAIVLAIELCSQWVSREANASNVECIPRRISSAGAHLEGETTHWRRRAAGQRCSPLTVLCCCRQWRSIGYCGAMVRSWRRWKRKGSLPCRFMLLLHGSRSPRQISCKVFRKIPGLSRHVVEGSKRLEAAQSVHDVPETLRAEQGSCLGALVFDWTS